jgi:glycosyltransferase involved in cell wall biosynthesis
MVVNDLSFSILMANYNNEKYIEEAIRSVINQSYPNWELIIVDDCSSDDSIEKIKPFLKDKRIKIIQHEQNLGYGGSLKTAADSTSNKVIGILDSDDKLHKKALETMASEYYKSPNYGFIYSTMLWCDSHLNNCIKVNWIGPTLPKKTNIFTIRISHFKTFLREAYLKTPGYDPNQKKAVDKDIIYKLEEVTDFKFINIPLYYYRFHGGGISQEKNHYSVEFYQYIAKLKAYRRRIDSNIPNLTKKQIQFDYYRITFYKLTHFLIRLYRKFKISEFLKKVLEFLPFVPPAIILKIIRKFKKIN